ncbi:MAG TPA: P-II family nitrogen regulator [Bacteroidia bacterium]|nr:P-II family nitrogen regulator [Bacteroidia bacterium]
MKKLELVIDAGSLPKIKEIINSTGVKGFTVLNIIEGKGEKEGYVKAVPELNSFEQYYVFVICSKEESDQLVATLTPYVSSVGGVIFTTTLDSCFIK